MGRQQRLSLQSGYHHVVNRGIDRRAVFRSDEDRVDFGQLIGEAHERTGVFVSAYCLMDNHFHLVLDCSDGGLSAFMHHLTGRFSRHWHLRHGGDGPVFRGRFTSRSILDEEYLVSAVRYVHRNPLAFLTPDRLESYRWSSLRAYLGHRRQPGWLRCEPVRTWAGGTDSMLRSTTGTVTTTRRTVDGCELRDAVRQVIDADTEPGDAATRAATAVTLLAAEMLDPPDLDDLMRVLVPSSAPVAARARRRARQQAESTPHLLVLAAEALDLLGLAARPGHLVPGPK